jgi:hypothetical protein
MNKKILMVFVGIFAIAIFATPVLAAPATKVPASTTLLSSIYGPPLQVQVTPSGVTHVDGIQYINTRTLTIGATEYDVYAVGSFDIDWNPTTGTAIFHLTAVWYVGSLTEPTSDGFSGNHIIKVFNWNPATMEGEDTTSHSVYQGFGSFAQNTLKFEYEGPYPANNPSGYCIIP